MHEIIEFLRQHGVMLLAGSSALLAMGSLGVLVQRSPIQRQRLGELTLVCVLAWLVLASVPLPRYLADRLKTSSTDAIAGLSSSEAEVAVPVLYLGPNATLAERGQQIDEALAALQPPTGELAPSAAFVEPEGIVEPAVSLASVPSATADSSSSAVEVDDALSAPASDLSPVQSGSPQTTAIRSNLTLTDVLPWLFLAGGATCLAWLALGRVLLVRISRTAVPVEPWLQQLYESLPMGAGQQRPQLLVTRQRGQAMSWGIWRPKIAVSAELCRPRFREQLRHVLLHEMAHMAQRDARGTLLFNVAFVVLYFHPLYWWLRAKVRFAGELIADDWAVAHSTPERYAEELMSIVRGFRGGFRHLQAMTIFRSPTQFYRRMNMLLERENPLATGCPRWWTIAYGLVCVAGVGLAAAIAGVAPAGAESPAAEENEQVEAAVDQALDGIDAEIEQAVDQALGNLDETIDEAVNRAVEQAAAAVPAPDEIAAADIEQTQLNDLLAKVNRDLAKTLRQEADLASRGRRIEIPKEMIELEVSKDGRLAALETQIAKQQDQLSSLRSVVRNPDLDPGIQKLAADIGTLKSQIEDRKQEVRTALTQKFNLELAKKDAQGPDDDERGAYEKQRRDLEQQRRSIEEKLRALDGKRKDFDEKLKSAKQKSEGNEKDIDRALDEKAGQQAKEAARKAAEQGKRAAEKAMAAAKKAAEQGKEAAEKSKRRAAEKIEGERRDSDGGIESKLKAADGSREKQLREFDAQIERQMKDMQAQIERRLKAIDGRIEQQLKQHDAQIERGKKELAQRDGIKRKIMTDKEEIEEGASSDDRVRELQRAKEDLGRHVKELEAANGRLTRQVRDMERALEELKRKVKSGSDSGSTELEKPKRTKPAKPSSQSKEADAENADSDSTAAAVSAPEVAGTLPAAATLPKLPAAAELPRLPAKLISAPGASAPPTPATPANPAVSDPFGAETHSAGATPEPAQALANLATDAPQVAQRLQHPQNRQSDSQAEPSRPSANVSSSTIGSLRRATSTNPDPVILAKEYSDALSALEGAIADINRTEQLVKQGSIPAEHLERPRGDVKRAQRRITLLRTIAQGETEKAQAEIETTEAALKEGHGSKVDRAAAVTRLRLLKLILDDEPPAVSQNKVVEADAITIAEADRTAKGTDMKASREVRVFKLRNTDAAEAETAIIRLFGDGNVDLRTSKDDRTNSVVVRASAEMLKRIEDLIKRLDDGENPKSIR